MFPFTVLLHGHDHANIQETLNIVYDFLIKMDKVIMD